MTPEEITAMAKEAGMHIYRLPDDYCKDVGLLIGSVSRWDGVGLDELQAFAALVAEKAAARERERLFGAGRPLDGEMCVSIKRWSGGECFAYATRFTAAQTLNGLDGLLQKSVLRMSDELEAAIRARGQKGGV